jgi:hypothetical protein
VAAAQLAAIMVRLDRIDEKTDALQRVTRAEGFANDGFRPKAVVRLRFLYSLYKRIPWQLPERML